MLLKFGYSQRKEKRKRLILQPFLYLAFKRILARCLVIQSFMISFLSELVRMHEISLA